MTDGHAAAPIPPAATEGGLSPAAYARIYEAEQPHLVAYARSLTGNAWLADDLVAEAHFRVWRRLAAGHDIDNVAAYLTTTVRNLAASAGRGAARETPLDPHAGLEPMQVSSGAYGSGAYGDQDPAARASSVDLLAQVLGQLPKRWVKALWLSEAEGQPLEAVGRGIGAGSGATAVLLHRAREGMRQGFLRAHPGTPDDPACESHWDRMPAHVRGSASARQSEKLLAHVDDCDDCRARLAVLLRANDRLPALVGPALLIFVLGGAGKFLVPLMAGAGATGAAAGGHGAGSGLLHGVRHALTGGAKAQGAVAGVLGVSVAGAAVAAGLMLTGNDDTVPPQRSAAVQSESPGGRDDAPSSSSSSSSHPSPSSSSHPSTSASREPVAPQDRSQGAAEPGSEAAPEDSVDADKPAAPKAPAEPQETEAPSDPATPAAPSDPPAAERAAPQETPAEQGPDTPTPTPTPSTDAPTPTPTTEPSTPTSPAPTTPEPTEPSEPTTPPEPTTPTPPQPSAPSPTCTRWLGPIYFCHTG